MFVPSPAKKNSVYCICKPEWKEVRGLKKADLTRAILETTISKALRDIQADPERSIRNLVDLGRSFSNGRFQKEFFRFAQTMLENEHSAYYPLVKDVVDQVNPQTLQTFGINIGYNACTHGAKQIRANEAKFGFNIPWAIAFQMAAAPGSMQLADFCSMIDQGMELGVYTYLLFWDARPAREIVPLLQKYPDCAFSYSPHRKVWWQTPSRPCKRSTICWFPFMRTRTAFWKRPGFCANGVSYMGCIPSLGPNRSQKLSTAHGYKRSCLPSPSSFFCCRRIRQYPGGRKFTNM